MNAKKSVTRMVIVPKHVKHAVNVTKDFSDRAVFASKGAEQHTVVAIKYPILEIITEEIMVVTMEATMEETMGATMAETMGVTMAVTMEATMAETMGATMEDIMGVTMVVQ